MSFTEPWQHPDTGQWMIPKRVDDEGVVGFGWVELTPEEPDYQQWVDYIATLTDDSWAEEVDRRVAGG